MHTYRAFRQDLAGKTHPIDWFVALSDSAATSEAADLCNGDTKLVQLWQGSRLVGSYAC